jgi:lysophospholipase L1-like esterase
MPSTITPPLEKSKSAVETVPAKPRKRKGWLVAAEAVALSAVAIAGLEGFLKMAAIGQQEFLEPDKELGCRHMAGKQVTWRLEGFSNDSLSSAGLRDTEHSLAKPANVTRIAVLGDSSTEGMQVALPETYTKVLEKNLNRSGKRKYEVINFGCSSYSTGQQVLQYERDVRRYKPDIVVLLYNRGDSVENVFVPGPGTLCAPRPYFYLDSAGNLQCDRAVMAACSSKLQPNAVMDYLHRNSRIYGVLSQTGLALAINEARYRKISGWWSALTASWSKNDGPSTWTVPYAKQDPEKVTTELLTRLQSDVEKDGAKFVLAMFPNSVQDPLYMRQESEYITMSAKNHFSFVDLTGPFFAQGDTKPLFLQYHFSAKGHEVVAQQLLPLIKNLEQD